VIALLYVALSSRAMAQIADDHAPRPKTPPPEQAQAETPPEGGAGVEDHADTPVDAGVVKRVEELRGEGDAALARGQFEQARREFEEVLKLSPSDASAARNAARAASAAGQMEDAARALETAHHLEGHERDPELHYLRGEALFVLGRDEEARREQRIAELEIGPTPSGRMAKLWLARIYARRGYYVLADRLYEPMWPKAPKVDLEVAVNQADAHLMNKDWEGAVTILRRYMALDPKTVRPREMLAWALEVVGDLDGELDIRRDLARDVPTGSNHRDYARALERAADFTGARTEYEGAQRLGSEDADGSLATSVDRMRYRTSPEVGGGFSGRADPQASALRLQIGGALPFWRRDILSLISWRDESHGGFPSGSGSVTGIGATVTLSNRAATTLIAGADIRYSTSNVQSNGIVFSDHQQVTAGAQAELDAPMPRYVQMNVHLDLNEQWSESPITIQEGGVTTGATGHLYLFPQNRQVLVDLGAQVRRLSLTPREDDISPRANQQLYWAGLDVLLWSSPLRLLRGEVLDERMARRVYLSDAGILSYRHYQLFSQSEPDFAARIAIAPRAAIHNGWLSIRKVLARNRAGFDLRAGIGYDTAQNHVLAQGGVTLLITPSWSSRLAISYDVTRETATGLTGTLQTGWIIYHADL
jgi:tetratricopeptide (TPR) repeat protein